MIPHRRRYLMPLLIAFSLALVALALPAAFAAAQATTPAAPTAEPGASPAAGQAITATLTITPTRTPAPTPTSTPTLTALQARLLLAQTYLKGGDFARAAEIFAAVAAEDRGNPEAVKGLEAALQGQASARATAAATPITPTPTPTPRAGLGTALADKGRDLGSTVLIGFLLVVLAYLLAQGLRWLLYWLREVWLLRILPLLKQPAVLPGFHIGEFTDATGLPNFEGPRLVAQTFTEKLVAWKQLVKVKELPLETAPAIDLGGMGWVKVLWSWILPPPRGYEVTGLLLGKRPGDYRLAVQRIALDRNRVDASRTFTSTQALANAAFTEMAAEAAKWVLTPRDMEASSAAAQGLRATRAVGAPMPLSASEVFDRALDLLLPVRQQVNLGAIDFNDARRRLQDAQGLLNDLPDGSQLRQDLAAVIADLRRSVPGV